jgi:hypothetical protein
MSENGRLSASELAPIASGQLRTDCAAAWNAMNVEARRLGCELLPNGSKSSYRTYAQQVELWQLYQSGAGALAAHPGSSNHGWGLAVDVATMQMRRMIDRIGDAFGWAKWSSDAPCVPLSTRILTRDGFKTHDELQPGDETIGYNLATGKIEWTEVMTWGTFENAPVTRYASSRLELVCTPNHRWIAVDRRGQTQLLPIDEIPTNNYRLVVAAEGAEGSGLNLTEPECALLGWAMTDGSIYRFENTRGRRAFARIYQRKEVGIEALHQLMEHFPHRHDDTYKTSSGEPTAMWYVGRGVFSEILHRSQLDETGPVRMVLAMTAPQRKAWFDAVRVAEGDQPKMRIIAQADNPANGPMREAIAVAGFLEGHQPSLRPRTVDMGNPTPWRHRLIAEDLKRADVWCPQTMLGTWTAEDGKSLLLTGNSEWWHLKWREGSYHGPDPGAYGEQAQSATTTPEPIQEADMITAVVKNNGAIEVFVEKAQSGEVFHIWQPGENKPFEGGWKSMGTPGKK